MYKFYCFYGYAWLTEIWQVIAPFADFHIVPYNIRNVGVKKRYSDDICYNTD